MDGNGHPKWTPGGEAIGQFQNASREDWQGKIFRELFEKHGLAAQNTFLHTGPTFYGAFSQSTVDFIGTPGEVPIKKCCCLKKSARALQYIPVSGHRDHIPLQLVFEHQLQDTHFQLAHQAAQN